MAISPNLRKKLVRAKKTVIKIAIIIFAVFNVFVILPGVVMALVMGEPTPGIVLVLLSLAGWAGLYGLSRFIGWYLNRTSNTKDDESQSTELARY